MGDSPRDVILKICNECKVAKPRSEFYCRRAALDGLQYKCKACSKTWYKANSDRAKTNNAAWRKANPGADRKRKYNLSPADYEALQVTQAGLCAICGGKNRDRALCVDHDHTTGKIRGLLCTNCNQGLGRFKDSYEILIVATAYLKKWKTDFLI